MRTCVTLYFYHYYRPQRSCDKIMFSQASVILFTGGVADTPWTDTPRGQTPPLARHPPRADTHTPPAQCMLGYTPLHCSGWYASYWNAFLYFNTGS